MPHRIAVKRPVGTLMLYAGLLLFGLFAALNLPLDFLPALTVPTLVISASYPGASSEEVRQLVTLPLEDACASLKGIRSIRSLTRRGVATLTLEYQWGADMTVAGVEARETIDAAYTLLPQDAERPRVLPVDPNAQPVLIVGVRAREGMGTARMLADREIATALQQVDGVGSVILAGGADDEIQVRAGQSRLMAAGLDIDAVASFLSGANIDMPAGSFTEGTNELLVRASGRVTTPEELADLRIPLPGGGGMRMGDLAEVSWQPKEQVSLFMSDARESVGLMVRGRSGESPVRLSERLRAEVRRLSQAYGTSLEITVVEDGAATILRSIRGLVASGLIGAAAAFLVMLLFLRQVRPAAILISAVPSSILFCLLLLWVTGRTINVMSLGGMALSVGMLVDDGVVVLENLQRRLSGGESATLRAAALREGIVRATAEVAGSILGSTLTTMIVFVPVLFLPGLIGALYADLALAVIYCLFASLVVSVTLIPVLFLLTSSMGARRAPRASRLERGYRRSLAAVLRRPWIAGAALGIAAAACIPLVPATRLELVPPYDDGSVSVRITAPPSTSMERMKRIAAAASRAALALPRVSSVWCRAGGEADDTFYLADPDANRETLVMTVRTRYGRRPDSLPVMAALREALVMEGAAVEAALPRSSIAQLLGLRAGGRELLALGATPLESRARAEEACRALSGGTPPIAARVGAMAEVTEMRYEPERDAMARAGVTPALVARAAWEGLEGAVATTMASGGREYDVRVLLAEPDRTGRESLSALRVRNESGGTVEAGEVVRITAGSSPSVLVRENRQDACAVRLGEGADAPGAGAAISRVAAMPGMADNAQNVFSRHASEIGLILAVAFLLLYLLLGAQFESLVQPLIILIAVPLAAAGVLAALLLAGQSLNLTSGLGVLVLFGTVVKVSIILFANYRRRVDAGAPFSFAVYAGTSERLRPILISTLATIAGLLPIAVNWNGLSTEDGIAIAVIGGTAVSTVLTLYAVPLVTWGYYGRRGKGGTGCAREGPRDGGASRGADGAGGARGRPRDASASRGADGAGGAREGPRGAGA